MSQFCANAKIAIECGDAELLFTTEECAGSSLTAYRVDGRLFLATQRRPGVAFRTGTVSQTTQEFIDNHVKKLPGKVAA